MKKIISLLMVFVIAFSFASTAFAKTASVSLDVKKTVTVEEGENKVYSFTAPSDGIFAADFKLVKGNCANVSVEYDEMYVNYADLYNSFEIDGKHFDYDGFETAKLYFCGEKGKSFDIVINNWDEYLVSENGRDEVDFSVGSVKVSFTVSKVDAPEIKLGKNKTYEDGDVFLFIPEKTGYYNFRSNAASNTVDPQIEINDINGSVDFNDDIGYSGNLNFDLTVKLRKGHVYGVLLGFSAAAFEHEVASSYTFTVSYNKKIEVESFILGDTNGKITAVKGSENYYYINVVPSGARPTADIKVEVEKEKLASVQYDKEECCLVITPNKIGATKITLSADGASAEYKLVCVPRIIARLQDIWWTITYRLSNLFSPDPYIIGSNY